MNLFQVKPSKQILWPTDFTPLLKGHKMKRRGELTYKLYNRVVRAEEGFILDADAAGEIEFIGDQASVLEPVPKEERKAALEKIKEQGPITFQPALDWLEEQGLRAQVARPALVEEKNAPPSRMKKAALEAECDRLELPHGTVAEMRDAIAALAADGEEG